MNTAQNRPVPPAVMQSIQAALRANDTNRAATYAANAIEQGFANPLILNLAAFREEQRGNYEGALKHLSRAEHMVPGDILILTALGQNLSKLGRDDMAREAFQRVIESHPGHAPAYHGLGLLHGARGEMDQAFSYQKRAAELDPNYPDPVGALAEISMGRKDKDGARHYAERAVKLERYQPPANVVLAILDAESGNAQAAIDRLDQLHNFGSLTPLHQAVSKRLLAEQLEKVERFHEAFLAFKDANDSMWRVFGESVEQSGVETGRELCRRLATYFEAAPAEAWRVAPGPNPTMARTHVFLLGFVRSGTTLLEQVLASHPDVVALEEMPTLRPITAHYFPTNEGLDRLANLSEDEAERLRAAYWDNVREFGADVAGKVFVDKGPLSTIWLPALARLFPDAKIIFARRDPRDVALSSFKHAFSAGALVSAFVDLSQTAHFYSEVMALAEIYRSKLDLQIYTHRHEAMVADFDSEVQALCDFLGLEWTPEMRDFAETAKRRNVRTPSADQVRAGLNSGGVAQWRNYIEDMKAVLPVLEPWVETYGYPAS